MANYAGDNEAEVDGDVDAGEMTPTVLKRGSRACHMGRSVKNLNGVFDWTIYATYFGPKPKTEEMLHQFKMNIKRQPSIREGPSSTRSQPSVDFLVLERRPNMSDNVVRRGI
ncbi:hypothetical protein TIFTF001_031405 [Ficus carica]|uniref:Uncharacterized protein n=1 Tax=Ficus carica TaxID=3494 RepID=A0AA88DWW4_FICCA|nr:hypothetical protein TIFTF001_031405 [Ficus carica]